VERQRLHLGLASLTLNRIVFDGHGGRQSAERWNVGRRDMTTSRQAAGSSMGCGTVGEVPAYRG
jgi:hypothetical protein